MNLQHFGYLPLILIGMMGTMTVAHLVKPQILWLFGALNRFSHGLCEALAPVPSDSGSDSSPHPIPTPLSLTLGPCFLIIGAILAAVDIGVIANSFRVVMSFTPTLSGFLAFSLVLSTFVSAMFAHLALVLRGWARVGLLLLSVVCLGVNMNWQFRLYYARGEIIRGFSRQGRHSDRANRVVVSRIGGKQMISSRRTQTSSRRYIGPSSREMAAIPLSLAAVQGCSFAGGLHLLGSLLPTSPQTFRDFLVKLSTRFWKSLWALFSVFAAPGGLIAKAFQAGTDWLRHELGLVRKGLVRAGKAFLTIFEVWCQRQAEDPLAKEKKEALHQLEMLEHRVKMAGKKAEIQAVNNRSDRDKTLQGDTTETVSRFRKLAAEMTDLLKDVSKIDLALVESIGNLIRERAPWPDIREAIREGMEVRGSYLKELITLQKTVQTSLREMEKSLHTEAPEA